MTDPLLCFGGPLNERMIAAEGAMFIAPVPVRVETSWAKVDGPTASMELRTVTYRLERVAYKDWVAPCWVAEGYPMHRITDALNVIIAMARL